MICPDCKKNKHHLCPSINAAVDSGAPPTGLSPDGDAVQFSGLCPCHHKPWPAEKRQVELVDA